MSSSANAPPRRPMEVMVDIAATVERPGSTEALTQEVSYLKWLKGNLIFLVILQSTAALTILDVTKYIVSTTLVSASS
ncbi:hypothetical protein TSUD_104100 [Trifolium subterraneum]|uniref:Uncharacterized protein n=1 Tax=Trifolium subterraneum TaxID=3900 RepID=A0A2Z6M4L4_TRISU|nr:hypothetical protein TSUD_104100 [Trifolium subterraneum]